MVVVAGEKSGEMSGANQYVLRIFCARSNDTVGVSIDVFPFSLVTVANEGTITPAEELVAFVTVTGSFECPVNADLSSAAGSVILKNTAVCSNRDRSYCISISALPFWARVMVSVFIVNACAGITKNTRMQRHPMIRLIFFMVIGCTIKEVKKSLDG